ncbi:hypothetical protein EXIGLDRAFT_767641 [Exidia glandulosa HHB12029]|uniref:Uncharacterized protein n=1 Tax=Exidia glandulosa HHB12029 TaxID=1314781 RepID=A0A165IUC0_EXIGL|nr:hypothetical protein EXIGLDRAFT_767641 [Exidia glandulosa HHB12029]
MPPVVHYHPAIANAPAAARDDAIWRCPPKDACSAKPCVHSSWPHDHEVFTQMREYQAAVRVVDLVNLYDRDTAFLKLFRGVYVELRGGMWKAVSPNGYLNLAKTHGFGFLDRISCLCLADPSVQPHAARARIRKDKQGVYWLSCHRAPKVVKGEYDFSNTCGMNIPLKFWRGVQPGVARMAVPPDAILLPMPSHPAATRVVRKAKPRQVTPSASTSTSASASPQVGQKRKRSQQQQPKRSRAFAASSVIDLTSP